MERSYPHNNDVTLVTTKTLLQMYRAKEIFCVVADGKMHVSLVPYSSLSLQKKLFHALYFPVAKLKYLRLGEGAATEAITDLLRYRTDKIKIQGGEYLLPLLTNELGQNIKFNGTVFLLTTSFSGTLMSTAEVIGDILTKEKLVGKLSEVWCNDATEFPPQSQMAFNVPEKLIFKPLSMVKRILPNKRHIA